MSEVEVGGRCRRLRSEVEALGSGLGIGGGGWGQGWGGGLEVEAGNRGLGEEGGS